MSRVSRSFRILVPICLGVGLMVNYSSQQCQPHFVLPSIEEIAASQPTASCTPSLPCMLPRRGPGRATSLPAQGWADDVAPARRIGSASIQPPLVDALADPEFLHLGTVLLPGTFSQYPRALAPQPRSQAPAPTPNTSS